MFKKSTIILAAALLSASVAGATEFKIDKTHSEVGFKVRHFLSKTAGRFDDFSGTIQLDESDLTKSSVELKINASSVDTDNADRDKHLKTEDFFWVEKYPEITFRSTKIVKTGNSTYDVVGNLTMRGVTKTITLPVSFMGKINDPWGNVRVGFETATKINRKEYGINWNKALDQGGFMLSDDVDISINIEAVHRAE